MKTPAGKASKISIHPLARPVAGGAPATAAPAAVTPQIEERVEQLELAYRALAAQHVALQTTCRAMLPLIDAPGNVVRRMLLAASCNDQIDAEGHDEEFRAEARYWIDLQAKEILTFTEIRERRPGRNTASQ